MAPSIATLISSAEGGDRSAADALFGALYADLHRLAKSQLARNGGATIGTTTLLHEAYIDIAGREAVFPDRARFMGYAAKVMRGLIIDYARSRQALKRGGAFEITTLETEPGAVVPDDQELTRIGAAVDELAAVDPPLAEHVDLRCPRRLFPRRDRSDARRFGADRPAPVGQGPHLSPPRPAAAAARLIEGTC